MLLTAEQKQELLYELAHRKSRNSLQSYLDRLIIDASPEPLPFKEALSSNPWQKHLYDRLTPLFEMVAGLKPYDPGLPNAVFIVMPRGHSKTSTIAQLLNWLLCYSRRTLDVTAAASDFKQVTILLERMKQEARRNPWLSRQIQFLESGARGPRGELKVLTSDAGSSSGLLSYVYVCDEITWWKKKDLWDILFSGRNKRTPHVFIVLTNAGIKRTWQHDLWIEAQNNPRWIAFEVPPYSASWISQEAIEEDRKNLLPSLFARVHENRWSDLDEEAVYVTHEQCLACEDESLPLEPIPDPRTDYVLSLDLGVTNDYAASALTHRDEEGNVILDAMRVWVPARGERIPIVDVKEYVDQTIASYPVTRFILDPYQLEQLAQEYEQSHTLEVIRYSFQGQGHMKLAQNLRDLISSRRIRWHPGMGIVHRAGRGHTLSDELSELYLELSKDGRTYRFQHKPNQHDDRSCALALAALETVKLPIPHEMNIVPFSRIPREEDKVPNPLRFPRIRFFGPHQTYQPTPEFEGEIYYLKDYKLQQEAYYAVTQFHRLLNLPNLPFDELLSDERKAQIEREVKEFIEKRQLKPQSRKAVKAG